MFDQRNGARTNATLAANWRAKEKIGALHRVAISARGTARHESGETSKTTTTMSAALNAQIGEQGPLVSAVVQSTNDDASGETRNTNSLRVRALQRFDYGSVTASYGYSSSETEGKKQQYVWTAQGNAIERQFDKGASVQVIPNLALNWDGEKTRVNAGASMIADSGQVFGSKFNLQSRVSTFSDFTAEDETAQSTRVLGSLEARYHVTKNAQLTASYTDDFQGRSDFSIGVRGALQFNPPRAGRLPDEGRGVLNGRVFLDRNRDGIRQAN